MESLVQQTWESFLRVMDEVVQAVEGGSYRDLQERLRQELDRLGRDILQSTIEAADERLREQSQERRGWTVVRRADEKEMLSPFGPVQYHRTYFRNTATRRYRHLVDEWMGLTPHARIDPCLKAELVAKAVDRSYRKSGEWSRESSWNVSGQTVMNALRSKKRWEPEQAPPKQKRQVDYLYIEADEDHVANQNPKGPQWQPRLVYVHEGLDSSHSRPALKNVHHLGGLYRRSTRKLCEKVWRYCDTNYDLDAVKVIFVSGDGAAWIRQLAEYMPKSVFVLDKYHVSQYITGAMGTWRDLTNELWSAILGADRQAVRSVLKEGHKRAETDARRRRIEDAHRYFMRQWDGIQAWRTHEKVLVGCSAEGHVSHIYSARMSSRPMAWTQQGVDQMAQIRVMHANGHCIRDEFLKKHHPRSLRPSERWMQDARQGIRTGQLISQQIRDNLPALRGRRSMLTRALRGLTTTS